jgi:hypothetical protein
MSQIVFIGNTRPDCTATEKTILLQLGDTRLLTDKTHYYANNVFFGMSMCIERSSVEGVFLKSRLASGRSDNTDFTYEGYLLKWLQEQFLSHVDPADITDGINKKIGQSFNMGMRAKAEQVRRVLFMENGTGTDLVSDSRAAGKRAAQGEMRDALGLP